MFVINTKPAPLRNSAIKHAIMVIKYRVVGLYAIPLRGAFLYSY